MFKLTVVVCFNVYQVFPRGPLVINGKIFPSSLYEPFMRSEQTNSLMPYSLICKRKCLHKKLTFCQDQEKNSFCFCSNKALEIRGYLKSCGADINEESMSPLHEDLEQLLMACNINFKSEAGMCLKVLIISTYL